MTRLELARKHAEELKGKSVKTETSSNSDARLELARKHAEELKEAQEERNKQAQLAQEYIAEHGTDEINQKYNEYMQSVNEIIAPKLYQTKGMQELASKRNVITPQEVTKLSTANADKIDKYGDSVFNTAVKEDWANKGNLAQRRIANKMGLKSDNSYIEELAKRTYNTIGSIGYGMGRTVSKLGMKAALNLADQFANLGSDFNKQIERQQALTKEGVPMWEAMKIADEEIRAERAKRREKIQNIVNQLDSKTIQEYGNKTFLVSASNFASDTAMAILGANGMTSAGINPIVSNALAQGAKGYAESASSTTNRNDIAVNTISNGAWGAIFNGANNLLGKTGLGKVSTNKLANFGRIFAKNALSSAIASGTTQTLDMFKSNPNYDYIDWQEVEKGIQSGKYKNIEEFLDSNDYISMVTKNRASQITISAIITAFINTFVEYGKNPSIQQIQKQDDAYKTLGLSKNASDEEIRSAYRKLAKLYHPDNSTTGNTEMFTKISEAYHTIIDSRIISQSIQTTQPTNTSQNSSSSLMKLPQGDISYLYQKYNIPKINTNAQLQQNTQNTSNNVQNVSNNEKLPQNASNNVSELPQNTTNTTQGKVTTPTNKSQNLIPNNSNIRGLEDYTEQDIKNIVSDYIQDLDTGVKIKDIALNGSRARGNSKATSDLDVVVEYDGDMTEDSLFNELNKEPLIIDGIKVDINPITASKSGTLEEYMKRSKSYDEQQNLITNTQTSKAKEVVEELAKEYDGYILVSKISDKATEIVQDELGSKAKLTDNMVLDRKKEIEKQIEIELVNQGYEINKDWEGDSYYAPKSEEKADPLTETNTKTSASENLTANDSVQSKSTNKNVTARSKTKAEKIEDFGEKIGGARKDLWVGTIGHAKKEVIPNYSIARDITTNEDGTEITDYSVKFKGETLKSGLKTEKEAEEFINSFKSSLKANRATVKKSEYFQNEDGTDAYEIVVTDPKTLKKSSTGKIFYDKAEAESYAMALSMYLSENGKNIGRPAIQVITRINPEFANTKKATGQDILDDFKFRAGEFGNWVSNAERQKFLNYCYDALTDLAIVLDVPLDNISYRGKMAIAFGARGRGLVGAAAHFEPDAKVINMTRLKGAGSLAHEMGHALDNYLSQISGYGENELLSTHSSYGKLPEKVKEAYRGLLDAIQYNTSTNQEEIDKKNRIYEKNRKESLEYYLKYYDEVFKGEASTYKKVKGKYEKVPIKVTDEQKQEYQRIRNILFDGKLENKLEFNSGEPGKSWTYAEPLETLRKLIKEVTNKKANNDTLYSIYTYGKQSKEVKEVKSQSAFSKAALELDRVLGRATAYASTIQEKIARSFEAFIYDELEKKGITDTYLVHSVHNRDYALFNPFPAGEERTKINTAWRNLINAMKDEALFDESSTIVFEPKEEYNVDIMSENDYNSYTVERKKETRKYVYKRIQKQDYARLQHDYDTNRGKYTKGIDVIDFPECSYIYNNTGENIELLSKFKGSQKFIEEVKKNVKDVFNGSSKGLNSYLKSLRSKRNKNNINNAISGRTTNSEYGSRQNITNGGQQREDYITKSDSNNVNSIQRKLENSKQSSFSLSKNNLKLKEPSEEYDFSSIKRQEYSEEEIEEIEYNKTRWRGVYDFDNRYDRQERNVELRNNKNRAILANKGVSEEVIDILEELTSRRHELHSSDVLFNVEVDDNGLFEFLASIDNRLSELGLPSIGITEWELLELPTDSDMIEFEEEHPDMDSDEVYDEIYGQFLEKREKINSKIEVWLKKFDNEFETNYAPTGDLRFREPSEEYNADLSVEEKLEAYVDRIKEGFGELDKIIGMGYNYLDTNYGIDNYKDKSVPSRNLLFDLEDNIRMQKHFAKENNIDISNMTDKERREYFDYRKNKKFETFVKKYVDNIYDVEKPIITPEELMEIAQDIHGTTDDYSVGAYMTIDGQLLDFDYGGFRDDHRSLSVPGYNMDSFMKAGNIRMQPEGSGFEVAVEPTEAQYERLADYIDNYIDDDINVDIDGTNDGRTYPRGTDSEKIIDDIRYYFRNGEFPQKSQYADFLNEPSEEYNIDDKTLVATHNITEEKMKGILELGGFPVPSIAISDISKGTQTEFGEITIFFDKETINPVDKRNEVYDRDVWSPTFPYVEYEINEDKARDIAKDIGISEGMLVVDAQYGNGYERLIKRLLYHDKVLDKYVQENNLDTEFKKIFSDDERRKFAKENGIEDYLREKLDGIYKERGILNSKGYLTPSGKRRKFWQAHDEYNLENLVKIMVKGETKGKQDTSWQIGNFGRISAQFGKKFKSIEDIKSSKARLQTSEELKAIEELRDKTYKDINELSDITSEYDYVREAIEKFAQKYQKNLTIDNFKKVLKDYNIKEYQINDELLQRIIDDLEQLKAIPTDYFESKPQRAVGFEEVRAVLVPATIDEELKQQLIDKGLNVVEYDPELKGDREAKYNELAQPYLFEPNTKYSRETSTETPIKVLKSTEKISKPQVVGQRIWEGFKKQGYIDLNGKTVRNSQDVAELSQIFRNPKYETFRIIYTNGNTIVGQEAVTSYLPNSARATTDENMSKAYYKIKDRMSRLSANGYYLVHNHPAGTAKASMSDIRTTEKIERNIKGFKGHVIVDHGTYAYIFKDDLGMNWQDELKVDDKNALYKGSQFETKLLSNKIPWNEIQIKSRSDFASLMHNLKNSTDYSTLILCDSKEKINAIIDVPNSFFNMRQSHVEGYIKNISKKYGAVDAFIGTSDENTFNKIQQFSNLRDSVLYKDNTKEFGSKKGNSVFNDEKSFAIRTTEETEEERRERVQKYIEEMQETIGTLGAKVDRKAIVDRIINDYGIVQKGNSKELNRVSKEIQNLIERGALTDSKIENYAEELIDNLRITVNDYYNANKELKELIRRTKLYASDTVKNGFGQWEEFRKQNIGTLRLTNDTEALPVDTFYKELTETYGESIFPSDIANTSDQLEKISEVAKSIKKIDQTLRENIEENFGEEAREEIVKGLVENLKTLREKAKQSSSTNEEVPPDTEIKKRSWTKTVRKNDMVSTFLDIKDMKYVVKGNKGTVARANDILESEGYEDSLKYFESIVESGKFPTANEIALGERLIQESIKLGKFEKATELVSDVSVLGTELGQSVQAMSIIHRLSPAGQLMHLKRAVDRMNKKQMEKGSSTSKLPKEIRKNSKLKEMVDKIVTGEQSKLKLKEEMQGKFDVNDIIDKIEKGEQEKIELPKEIKDNSDLMELITKIEKGEQTKIELQKETKSNTELGKIVTKVIDGEQTKMDLGITDEAISERKKFKKGKIELTPEMELAILCSQTPEELEMAVTRVKEQLAIQMPVSFGDKLQAWRYLAMLGNPVTHIKNVLGNTTMKIPYSLKNVTQRALETIFDDKLEERTRTFERATKDVKNFAEQMLMDNKDTLTGNGYSNIQSELMSMRRIFKTKWLEWTRKKVSNALSIEDFWAKKGVFKKALAEYLTANGIKTNQDIKNNQELVQKGINFAIEEALKATFNQYNKVASALNKFENTNELTKIAIGGTIPFKKTPMNITKTSVQYNSLGLAETLLIETKRLKKGKITENEYIERISQGLTGTGIMILGIWLASLGLISASGGSKEDKYKESIGMFRPYSINIGEIHIDITWLSPAAVPLLMGAEIYESAKGKDKTWWERILDGGEVLSKVLNPIAETTMLSSLNDVLSNYGGELSYDALGEVIKSIISSYIGQAFPTLGGRINRLIDPTIRSTAVSKNSKASFLEGIIRTNINKIPGLSYLLEPSIDIWGNVKKRSDSAVLRGANAFINPANLTIDESTKVDEEILRVYHVNENEKVLPKTRVNKYFTSKSVKYEMSAKEYTQFKIDYGQTAYSKLEELFSTKEYLQMSDTEKENAIDKVYDLANDIAKYRYMTDKYGEEGLKKILDDNAYKKYTKAKEVASITYEQYLEVYYAQSGIKSDKNKNGETIKGSETKKKVEAIQKALPKLTKEQATKLKKIFAGDLL